MNKAYESDESLMHQVALGRRDQLTPLVRRYAGPLLTFIQRMIGDRHRSEELVQEVFLRIWSKRRQYRHPRPFRPWLFTIAANHSRADFRRARPPAAQGDDKTGALPVAKEPTPLDAAISTEDTSLVMAAVEQLPAQQRTVVVLRVWNGLTYAEIADICGCAEGTVRAHMHHALGGMRRYLEPRMAS